MKSQKEKVDNDIYDVVICGAGISGALLANELSLAGYSVCILEAGKQKDWSFQSYQESVNQFYTQEAKVPNSPYPNNAFAPQSNVLDIKKISPENPDTSGYFVQKGPLPFSSSNTRSTGGTTLHWLGVCLRMFPSDFTMKTTYGRGVDWPIGYKNLKKYYEKAELEIGVSANTKELRYPGVGKDFFGNYEFPMKKIPPSYLDTVLSKRLDGMTYTTEGEEVKIDIVSIPQGRNSTPNENYIDPRTSKAYVPDGAVGNSHLGQRCEGNSSCIPICPVQAKYSALKTLHKTLDKKRTSPVTIKSQCVVTKVLFDHSTGVITGLSYQKYKTVDDPRSVSSRVAKAKLYILAGSAIENAKLLLASGAAKSSDQVGRNLMDHPYLLTWAMMPESLPVGPFRGPFTSSGIPSFRNGKFRNSHAGFRTDIGNWGWNFPTGAPVSDVEQLVDQENLFGKALKKTLYGRVQRQFRFGFLIEQLPNEENRVCLDPKYVDDLGNFRPVIYYNLTDYEKKGFAVAKQFSDQVFQRLGAAQYTSYNTSDPGFVDYQGTGYSYHGSGHIVGTHRMGKNKFDSVVDENQQAWDHKNLFVVGCGSMPTIGTSNPTLTLAAITLKSVDAIIKELKR